MEGLKAKYSQEFSQPGLFRAHSTGYIEMRSDRTSTGSNMSASSRGSNGFFSSRGVLRDSGSGSQSCMPQGGGYSGDLALSPAFPPVPIGLLRSVSHAGKLEDTTLSPNDSPETVLTVPAAMAVLLWAARSRFLESLRNHTTP